MERTALSVAGRDEVAPSLLADLLAAANEEERRRILSAMLHAIGFDRVAYGRLTVTGPFAHPVSLTLALSDTPWARRYVEARHFEADPVLHEALQTRLPCGWTLAGLRESAAGAGPWSPLARFVEDLAATGLRGGAVLVLPGADASERHLVSLMSRDDRVGRTDGVLLGQVLMLGLCLHEFHLRRAAAPAAQIALTPVQREILGQVARGASDKQIAYDLKLSSHAVDYHMRQLRRRFAVRNRVQLTQAVRGDGRE